MFTSMLGTVKFCAFYMKGMMIWFMQLTYFSQF